MDSPVASTHVPRPRVCMNPTTPEVLLPLGPQRTRLFILLTTIAMDSFCVLAPEVPSLDIWGGECPAHSVPHTVGHEIELLPYETRCAMTTGP